MSSASYLLALVAAAGSFAASHGAFGNRVARPECLRFKQPLGYSESGALEQGEVKWYVLALADNGIVRRPLFSRREREHWTRRSRWTTKGDTLLIRVSDGLVGWDISLRRERDHFTGVAMYLTDVHGKDLVPLRKEVHAVRMRCPAPPA
jgi:hypothetical protein